jgi:hypothetical protein
MTNLDDAQQVALAAEHRAVYGYGLLGPHLSGGSRSRARRAQDAHSSLRDQLVEALAAAHQTPVASQPSYPDLRAITSAAAAVRMATQLEKACAAAWRYVYSVAAVTDPTIAAAPRAAAQRALIDCAVRATQWRQAAGDPSPTVSFPGI